jgi:hypothetical protein
MEVGSGLKDASQICTVRGARDQEDGLECFRELGFTDGCASFWFYGLKNTLRECLFRVVFPPYLASLSMAILRNVHTADAWNAMKPKALHSLISTPADIVVIWVSCQLSFSRALKWYIWSTRIRVLNYSQAGIITSTRFRR